MENQEENLIESINKFYVLVIAAGALDLCSTLIGLSFGLYESNSNYFVLPFASTIMLTVWGAALYRFKEAPLKIRKGLLGWLSIFGFAAFLWNSYLILGVVL